MRVVPSDFQKIYFQHLIDCSYVAITLGSTESKPFFPKLAGDSRSLSWHYANQIAFYTYYTIINGYIATQRIAMPTDLYML